MNSKDKSSVENSGQLPRELYENLDDVLGSRRSAQEVLPLVLELIQPQSVIDVGCGVGSWLAVLKELGVKDVLGVDVEYMDKTLLKIPEEQFLPFDLKQPLKLNRQFDLVMCVEVAGYLPSEGAEAFVDSLTQLGSVVLFAAAVPLQDDPKVQPNQQWPEYWMNLFEKKGYVLIDCLRKKIWNKPHVAWWFSQNMFLFVKQDYLESNERLKKEWENTSTEQLSVIHPRLYLMYRQRTLKSALLKLPTTIIKSLKAKLGQGKA